MSISNQGVNLLRKTGVNLDQFQGVRFEQNSGVNFSVFSNIVSAIEYYHNLPGNSIRSRQNFEDDLAKAKANLDELTQIYAL